MPTNLSHVGGLSKDPEPGEAAELVELMRVWREEWYSFPPWETVAATCKVLRALDGGLWGRLSIPQRRMMCEVTAAIGSAKSADDAGLYPLLLKRCALRQQSAASAAAPAARAGTEPLAEQLQGREQSEQLEQPPRQQGPQHSPQPNSDPASDPMAEIVKAASRFEDGSRKADVQAARRNAAAHFPATFITAQFIKSFTNRHRLCSLSEWASQHAGGGDVHGLGGAYMPEERTTPVSTFVGSTCNLTVRQVWQRIVAPALEATHGMSYAEAFLSQVELFCSGAGPPPPSGPEAEGGAAPVATAAEAALARCEAVAMLAPADAWPLTAPLVAPVAASCAATTAVVLDAVRQHGVRPVTLRLKPPYR
ncbi:hypothetical protein GPECTOR_9g485 [Gonium pectorale]|uniref:Uncharacterized protein n=1 Tax=Gonium pectorale TaxID=33097 RepID=A0A150GRJ9_GONPE|nr:hypothetical protein GPECTOR_9g485 [Gonium pectorale]|eukprot:KXZ52441.1 hypothetical protein GPECTOR_9g485 [Gonium pectorale]